MQPHAELDEVSGGAGVGHGAPELERVAAGILPDLGEEDVHHEHVEAHLVGVVHRLGAANLHGLAREGVHAAQHVCDVALQQEVRELGSLGVCRAAAALGLGAQGAREARHGVLVEHLAAGATELDEGVDCLALVLAQRLARGDASFGPRLEEGEAQPHNEQVRLRWQYPRAGRQRGAVSVGAGARARHRWSVATDSRRCEAAAAAGGGRRARLTAARPYATQMGDARRG